MMILERTSEVFGFILRGLIVIVLLMSILAYFASGSVHCEALASYRLQYFVASILILIYFIVARKWLWFVICLVAVFMNGLEVIPWYAAGRGPERGTETEELSYFVANVVQENTEYEKLFQRIELEDPDVILLQEINRDWMGQIPRLALMYPYSFLLPEEDHTGIGLLSKQPFTATESVPLGEEQVPCIVASLKISGRTLTIYATHLTPPRNAKYMAERNEQLLDLADQVAKAEDLAVVLGGLNASIWSPPIKKFLADTDMQDARKGYGVLATWPTWFSLIRTPIDYCMVGKDIGVTGIQLLDPCGSDHYILYVKTEMSGGDIKVN